MEYLIKVTLKGKTYYLQKFHEGLPSDGGESYTRGTKTAMRFTDKSEAEALREELKADIEPSEVVKTPSSE